MNKQRLFSHDFANCIEVSWKSHNKIISRL